MTHRRVSLLDLFNQNVDVHYNHTVKSGYLFVCYTYCVIIIVFVGDYACSVIASLLIIIHPVLFISTSNLTTLTMEPAPPVTILGTTYPALADGVYDAIILGTGLKECIIAGLLATEGKKVSIL